MTAARRRFTSTGGRWPPATSARWWRRDRCGCSSAARGRQASRWLPIAGSAGTVVLALQAARQVRAAEDATGRGGRRQRIGGEDDGSPRPCGALLGPPLAVGEHQAGPVGAVLFTEVVHGRELLMRPSRVADRVQCHYKFAGFGSGDPRPVVDTADAQGGHHEGVPPL